MSEWTTGDADYILGMHVTRDFEAGTIKLSQPAAIEKLAKRFGLDDSRAAPRVPMQPDSKFSKPADEDVLSPAEFNLYQAKVGGALYLSLVSRPDVSFAVGVLTRFMSCAGPLHMKAIDRVISYLFSTRNLGVQFRRGCSRTVPLAFSSRPTSGGGNAKSDVDPLSKDPYNYADADFAGDVGTRRSTNGGCTLLHGGVVSWLSKLQPTVALSTAEAETNAAVEAVKSIVHTRLLMRELGRGPSGPTELYEDNAPAIAMVDADGNLNRRKHFQLKVHWLKDQKTRQVFKYIKVGTADCLADFFTKALPIPAFEKFRSMLGVC